MLRSIAKCFPMRARMTCGILALMMTTAAATLPDCRADLPRQLKSAREAVIAAALEQPTELDFADQPLTDVVEYLKQRHGIEIQFDRKAFSDAGVGSDTPITRSTKGITLDSALDLILSELDLTWVIHDEVLYITSNAAAQNMIETRVYPVRDLVSPAEEELSVDGLDYDSLVDVLAEAAGTTDGTPDPRSIRVYRPAAALVITRSVVVHRRIEKLLKELRQAKAENPAR